MSWEALLLIMAMVIIIVIIIAIIISYIFLHNEQEANDRSKNTIYTPVGSIITDVYIPDNKLFNYSVYFPLRNLDKLDEIEEKQIAQQTTLTIEQVKELFAPNQETLDICLNWLRQYGNVWLSPSNTCGILVISGTNLERMTGKILYETPACVVTQNDYFKPPHGMSFGCLNSVYDVTAERKNLSDYTKKYNLLNYSTQVKSTDFLNITEIKTKLGITDNTGTNTIGLITGSIIDENFLKQAAISLGYPSDQFTNNLTQAYAYFTDFDKSFLTLAYGIYGEGGDPSIFNPSDGESNLDSFTCFSLRPYGKVLSFNYATTSLDYSFGDPQPLIWSQNIKIFSSSYSNEYNIDTRDCERISSESRLLSIYGTSLFQASGDQGLTNLTNHDTFQSTFDIQKPDVFTTILSGAIKVGGFSYDRFQEAQGFAPYLPMQLSGDIISEDLEFVTRPFSTGGGYFRGISRPSFKNMMAQSYTNSNLWELANNYTQSNGLLTKFPNYQIEFTGDIYPDLTTFGALDYNFENNEPVGGTSFSSPLMASIFQAVLDATNRNGIVSLQRQLYTTLYPQLKRFAVGNNGIWNINGYQSDGTTMWDPVNGLGTVNYQSLVTFFS